MQPEIATGIENGSSFLLGEWRVEPTLNRLIQGERSVQLEHKAMDVLLCLAGHAGDVVTKHELLDAVWETEFVSDNTLQRRIAELRDAFGDDALDPRYIETIRKRGYRLIAEVGPIRDEADAAPTISDAPPAPTDDGNPYPGLAAFSESDAELFFGRERETAALWRTITSRRLLAVIGPSGIGKSSLLRAGVASRPPPGWRAVVFTPGESPVLSLARALAPDHAGDPAAVSRLVAFSDPDIALAVVSRWRGRFDGAVIIADQFEELFTLNTPESQADFINLLRRLVDAADVHVVLAMRDDFLYRCREYKQIAPIFKDLTPLAPPAPDALRRALTEPAARRLHRFESEVLVDRMVAEVESQRSALPLLAFAVHRMWEQRDEPNRILTEKSYDRIGGVGGALAQHAEELVTEIGHERLPIVREIFRNLVTAEDTRAVREIDELLSVFNGSDGEGVKPSPTNRIGKDSEEAGLTPVTDRAGNDLVGAGFTPARDAAREVLDKLIDARLLTTFETRDDEDLSTRRVEIVHESLLANWPRLVRWQTQDQEGAQLRDELRQAARTWDEHGRDDDRLWTGTAYREFRLWRERYPGGLTEVEDAFAVAMTAFSGRRRRRRRVAVAVGFAVLLAVLVVVGSFWQRSERETLRAEAANLVSQAQVELESYPSAAVAYATASLELSDSPGARRLALEALWKGPTAFVVNEIKSWEIEFTPDGRWLVQATDAPPYDLHVIGSDGSDDLLENIHNDWVDLRMDSETGSFITLPWENAGPCGLWSAPEKRLLARTILEASQDRAILGAALNTSRQRAALLIREAERFSVDAIGFDGTYKRLGTLEFDAGRDETGQRKAVAFLDRKNGDWLGVFTQNEAYLIDVGDHTLGQPRRLEHIQDPSAGIVTRKMSHIALDPLGRFVAVPFNDGAIRLWNLSEESPPRVIEGPSGITGIRITADGSMLEARKVEDGEVETWTWSLENQEPTLLRHVDLGKSGGTASWTLNPIEHQIVSILNPDAKIRLWPLRAPADSEPVIMQHGDFGSARRVRIHPRGGWLASSFSDGLTLWPVTRAYPIVIKQYEEQIGNLVFGPEGRWLATSSINSKVRLWHLEGDHLPAAEIVYDAESYAYGIAASPDGKQILLGTHFYGPHLLSLDDETTIDLPGEVGIAWGVAFSANGRLAAATGIAENSIARVIRVWDLDSHEEVNVFDLSDVDLPGFLRFTTDGQILSGNSAGLLRWNLETGESETLAEGPVHRFASSSDDARVVFMQTDWSTAMFPFGPAVLLDLESGASTPLTSHGNSVTAIAMDPGGRIVVTGDRDGVIRVGPITGEEPVLLLGSSGEIYDLAIDPKGRWIASASGTEVRLWPMPDLTKPPLHTLPREELIAKLKTLTNLRVVRDPESSTGWKLTHDPFPGWETVPTW